MSIFEKTAVKRSNFCYLYVICFRCNKCSLNPSFRSDNIFGYEHRYVVSKELIVKGLILCFHHRPALHETYCFIISQNMFYGYLTLLIMFIHFCVNESNINKVCTYINSFFVFASAISAIYSYLVKPA